MSDRATYHDEDTLFKVFSALVKSGLTKVQATDAINSLQNAGIYFRELEREDDDE